MNLMKNIIYNKIILKMGLYILSLFWLFVLLIICELKPCFPIKTFLKENVVSIIAASGLIFAFLFMLIFNHMAKAIVIESNRIEEIEDVSSEQLVFLATYILPLIFYEYNNLRAVFNVTLIMIIIGIIFCKTNLFYSNPTLSLFGYRTYKVKLIDSNEYVYLLSRTKGRLHKGDIIYVNRLNENTFFAHKSN